jgi:predicted Rossmann fold flavoprotein
MNNAFVIFAAVTHTTPDGYASRQRSDHPMRIAVIGGGPAGFFGAIAAATANPKAEIALFESTHSPLDKVRISGGGRCNVTNHCFDPALLIRNYPRGSRELRGPFTRFQPRDTIAWFERHGVSLKTEPDGRIFPTSDRSSTIVECLLETAASVGVNAHLGASVKNITVSDDRAPSGRFFVEFLNRPQESFNHVLLATGNSPQGHLLARNLGHSIVPCVPSLFTFKVSDPRLENLSGVSFDNTKLTLTCEGNIAIEQTGPLLITHWGLSGPAVLKLSAWGARILHDAHYHAELVINFLPNQTPDQIYQQLLAFKSENGRKLVRSDSPHFVPRRYWSSVVQVVGVAEDTAWADLTRTAMNSIVSELTHARFTVNGKGIFKEEFVTCGGVDLKEVDFKTMQSKLIPGLFLAGEILDIDGITGGFNFQSAWTTGWIAGTSMAI